MRNAPPSDSTTQKDANERKIKTQSTYGKIDENSSKDEMIAVIQHMLIKENDATTTAYFERATCTLVKS